MPSQGSMKNLEDLFSVLREMIRQEAGKVPDLTGLAGSNIDLVNNPQSPGTMWFMSDFSKSDGADVVGFNYNPFVMRPVDSSVLSDLVARTATYLRSVSDQEALSDSAARIATYLRALNDTLVMSDTIRVGKGFTSSVSDSLVLNDLVAALRGKLISASDSIVLSDTASVVRGAPTFRAASTATGAGAPTLVLSRPAGTANNDGLHAAITIDSDTVTITAPGGWNLVKSVSFTGMKTETFKKIASGEPPSWTFSFSASVNSSGAVLSYYGNNTTDYVDVENGDGNSTASTSHDTPSVTTTVVNTRVICAFGALGSATWTAPGGHDTRVSISGTLSLLVTDFIQAAAAATGAQTATTVESLKDTGHICAMKN